MSELSARVGRPPRVGFVVGNWLAPEEIGPTSRAVELATFDELWLAEDSFYAGGIAAAASALAATSDIPVAVGIFSCMVRHPALLAMELSALGRAHPGRFRPGIGLGLTKFLMQMDLVPSSPLSAVRSVVRDVRQLLQGEIVSSTDGPFRLEGVRLAHDCRHSFLPIIVGGMGPRMLRLAGELGDGVVLSVLAHSGYVEWAVAQIAAGARRSTIAGRPEVTVFELFSVDEDRDAARADAVNLLASFLGLLQKTEMVGQLGLSDVVAQWCAEGSEGLMGHITDSILDKFVVWGTPEDCAERIRRLAAAGGDAVALFPSQQATAQSIRLAGQRLLPLLRTADD
jgi:5,10-methylenetetrahydromethanopterin reductase